jgi:hypothetical protein
MVIVLDELLQPHNSIFPHTFSYENQNDNSLGMVQNDLHVFVNSEGFA